VISDCTNSRSPKYQGPGSGLCCTVRTCSVLRVGVDSWSIPVMWSHALFSTRSISRSVSEGTVMQLKSVCSVAWSEADRCVSRGKVTFWRVKEGRIRSEIARRSRCQQKESAPMSELSGRRMWRVSSWRPPQDCDIF